MLHIITEGGNSELKGRKFPIPDNVRKLLSNTLENYKGDKTIDGYKRLNNLLSMDGISYNEMKRIKNFFDKYNGSDKSAEYILNGGDAMKTWVNNTLNTATKSIHDFKQAKKNAGVKNAFIKTHNKDRQNKKKNKPTQVKFQTKNLGRKMLDGEPLKYENILRESIDIEEYISDYGVNHVLDSFINSQKGETQDWGVLINPTMYQKALQDFTKHGKLTTFPIKYIYQWIGILFRNTITLEANTSLAGHGNYFPIEEVEDFIMDYLGDKCYKIDNEEVCIKISEQEFIEICNSKGISLNENGIHKDGQYDLFLNQKEVDDYDKELEALQKNKKFTRYQKMAEEYNKKSVNQYGIETDKISVNIQEGVIFRIKTISNFLDEIGLYDWMVMPDGSEAWSDFGLTPIYKILEQYNDNTTPEEALVIINKVLDVYHCRGDISSIFIQGGNKSLSKITDGSMTENKRKKIIFITEKQEKMLREAADESFSLDTLTKLPSFQAKFKYCTEHLGKHIGKGSSRATFQISDEEVLKLAWNKKGVAQNQEERMAYGGDIFPIVYDSADDGSWIKSEFVLPAKKEDFKHCFNMSFDDFVRFIYTCGFNHGDARRRAAFRWHIMNEEDYIYLLDNNEDLCEFDEYIGNYGGVVVRDMTRLCNYGLTKRNGEPHIVLLDSGLTEYVWDNFYKR